MPPSYNQIMNAFKNDPEISQLSQLGIDPEPLLEAMRQFENATLQWNKNVNENYEKGI